MKMPDAEEDPDFSKDLSEFYSRSRWAVSWQTTFFVLFVMLMFSSLVLYLSLLRAIAINHRTKENSTYFFFLLFFFTSLVDNALIVQEFMVIHHKTYHSDILCGLYTYAAFGNRILQALSALTLVITSWAAVELTTTKLESLVKKYFPLVLLILLSTQFLIVIWPALRVKGDMSGQNCIYIGNSSNELAERWICLVLAPYLVPLLAASFPAFRLILKLRKNSVPSAMLTTVNLSLAVMSSFMLFHLLHFLLMLGREMEAAVLDRSDWRRLLGMHVWFVAKPMFALIAYGWHIVVPIAPFAFDRDFENYFPGLWINRRRLALRNIESRASIQMTPSVSSINDERGTSQC